MSFSRWLLLQSSHASMFAGALDYASARFKKHATKYSAIILHSNANKNMCMLIKVNLQQKIFKGNEIK